MLEGRVLGRMSICWSVAGNVYTPESHYSSLVLE